MRFLPLVLLLGGCSLAELDRFYLAPDAGPDGPPCGAVDQPCCLTAQPCESNYLKCDFGTCKPCIVDLQAGLGLHTCAAKRDGTVWCWGANDSGQLGDNSYATSSVPVRVVDSSIQPLQNADSVTVGLLHSCAHTKTGAVWCWGQNMLGQLGVGHEGDKIPTATEVPMLTNASLVSAGGVHTCTRKSDFTLWCWGNNDAYQLGISGRMNWSTPQYLSALGPIVDSVTAGSFHTCAHVGIGADCWGANDEGQLGNGTGSATTTPDIYTVTELNYRVGTLSAGDKHTCATTTDGELWCWGGNDQQQLGTGDGLRYPSPVRILPSGVDVVSAGQQHTCAIVNGGDLLCWGSNAHGQLGTGDMLQHPTATRVLSDVVQVSAGSMHTCARRRDGSILCWGANDSGQVGSGPPSPTPVMMPSPVMLFCGP